MKHTENLQPPKFITIAALNFASHTGFAFVCFFCWLADQWVCVCVRSRCSEFGRCYWCRCCYCLFLLSKAFFHFNWCMGSFRYDQNLDCIINKIGSLCFPLLMYQTRGEVFQRRRKKWNQTFQNNNSDGNFFELKSMGVAVVIECRPSENNSFENLMDFLNIETSPITGFVNVYVYLHTRVITFVLLQFFFVLFCFESFQFVFSLCARMCILQLIRVVVSIFAFFPWHIILLVVIMRWWRRWRCCMIS